LVDPIEFNSTPVVVAAAAPVPEPELMTEKGFESDWEAEG
jgi:hypothetical protein